MERKIKMLPPVMQNYIVLDLETRPTIAVTELTVEEAEEFGEMMKQEFIKHHNKLKDGRR